MPPGGKQATRSIRTLLVGGDSEDLDATKAALEKADGKNSVATMLLARDTIKSLRFGEYDCVVLCCHISKPGAEELAKTVGGMRRMPFIIYTTAADSDSILSAFKMGVTDYIIDECRPSSVKALAERTRQAVEVWRDSIRDAMILRILNAVNEAKTPTESVKAVLVILKSLTDAEALAIRLRNRGDYPYYAAIGFSDEHILHESSLIVKGSKTTVLDCMCGHVIQGRSDPKRPFFTAAGSFWTGSSSQLARELGDEAPRLLCRANCLSEGYESMTHIPLKNGDDIIGLLQVNDHRKDVVNPRLVSFLEELAAGISLALLKADTERTLRDTEDLFRALLENSNDPISISVDNVIVYANKRRAELAGYSDPAKLIGRSTDEFAESEDSTKLRQMAQDRAMGKNVPPRYEFRMKAPGGGTRYIEASHTPIVFRGQNAGINILHDITEARRYQEKISALHSHAAVLASADNLKLIVKTTLDACQRVLGFKLLTFFLLDADTLTPLGSRGMNPPKNPLRMNGKGITVKAAREKRTILLNDIRSDPDYIKGSVSTKAELAVPVLVADETLALINIEGTHIDAFTEMDRVLLETLASHVASAMYRLRHMEEDARAQAERTRELLESANRVTGMVRHDMRGPLQTIRSASFLLNADPSKAEMLTQTIDQSVDYASKILDDLRSNTTPIELQRALVNLKDIVEERIRAANVGEDIKVKAVFETEFIVATVDPDRIRRVLDNLIKNAVEAMPGGGTLTVKARRTSTSAVVEVRDTGTGIPPEVMVNLFKPFYSGKKGGTGLGLAFSKQAVEAHGGTISVSTKVGKGTAFRVTLPLTPPKDNTPPKKQRLGEPRSRAP